MKAFLNHVKIQLMLDFRNKGTLLTFYIIPILFYLVMGAVFSAIQPGNKTLGAAMTIFGVTMGAVLGQAPMLVQMREADVLKSLRVSGVPGWSVLFSRFASAFINLLIVSIIILYTAPPLFGAGMPVSISAYFGTLFLLIFTSIALGLLIGIAAKSQSMATMLAQVIFLPSILVGGIMFPATMLPESMQWVGRFFPATHAMQAFTGWSFGQETQVDPLVSAIVIAAIGIGGFIAAVLCFRKISSSQ